MNYFTYIINENEIKYNEAANDINSIRYSTMYENGLYVGETL